MDSQPKKITGYRDLTQEEIDLINESKELAITVGKFIEKLRTIGDDDDDREFRLIDGRWFSIAKTDLQKGFMALVRSIAKPESF